MAGDVGDGESQQLFTCAGMPNSDITVAAGGKQLTGAPANVRACECCSNTQCMLTGAPAHRGKEISVTALQWEEERS